VEIYFLNFCIKIFLPSPKGAGEQAKAKARANKQRFYIREEMVEIRYSTNYASSTKRVTTFYN